VYNGFAYTQVGRIALLAVYALLATVLISIFN
jgi:hypothetical protein